MPERMDDEIDALEVVVVENPVANVDVADVEEEVKETIESMLVQVAKGSLKCRGYYVNVEDIYRMISCHELDDMDVIMENRNVHDRSCAEQNYMTTDGNLINEACTNLQYRTRFQKLLERGAKKFDDPALVTTKNIHLSHSQLSDKARHHRQQKEKMRLDVLKSVFRYSKLCATLKLHERLLVLLSEHKVPRLQQLIVVAQNNKHGMDYIVTKVLDAINQVYTPNPSQDDKDLAFVVLKFGGPSLLNILHHAGLLQHESTANRMAKNCPPIVSSVKNSAGECFENNVTITEKGKFMVSVKMDETYVTSVLSYNQRDNEACGACYQHEKGLKLELDTYEDCERLEKSIEDGNLHIPKECLCVGALSLNENKAFQPGIIWPSCQKNDIEGTIEIITEIQRDLKKNYGYPAVQICTDGDSARRQVSYRVMVHDASDFLWFHNVSDLPLVDYLVGPEGETFSFDPKHLVKRSWCMCIREKMIIGGIRITKKMLKELLADNTYGVTDDALYPKDKQNVKATTNFLLAFIEATQKPELPYNLVPIKSELRMLGQVFYGLLSFYVFSDASISDQLKSFSTSSYILYHLFRENKSSMMPSQLYHDLQITFIDCLFVSAKGKELCPSDPCYTVEMGTDPEERYFGNNRMERKGGNYSALDMVNSARVTSAIDTILSVDHPDWTKKSRTQTRLQLDYSNPAVWDADKLTLENVNIKAVWRSGYYVALGMIPPDDAEDFEYTTTTLRCPLKKGNIAGVKNVVTDVTAANDAEEVDWSSEDYCDDSVDADANVNANGVVDTEVEEASHFNDEFSEMIEDPAANKEPFFMIDGKRLYKTTCLKSISSHVKLSKDRLRRVQGKSKYPGQDITEDNDSFLLIGDAVLITHPRDGPVIANITSMKKSNITVTQINITNDLSDLKNHELWVHRIETSLVDNRLYWSGSFIGDIIKMTGQACLPIKPSIEVNHPDGMTKFYFEYGLLQDMGVHLQLTVAEATGSSTTSSTATQQILKKRCFYCKSKKYIPLSTMRFHVAKHILAGQLSSINICGFCGRESCNVTMKRTKGKGQSFYSIDQCDCTYYYDYGRKKKFDKKWNPCTNRVYMCPIETCLSHVWAYNLPLHFEDKHPREEIPEDMIISKKEKEFILNSS